MWGAVSLAVLSLIASGLHQGNCIGEGFRAGSVLEYKGKAELISSHVFVVLKADRTLESPYRIDKLLKGIHKVKVSLNLLGNRVQTDLNKSNSTTRAGVSSKNGKIGPVINELELVLGRVEGLATEALEWFPEIRGSKRVKRGAAAAGLGAVASMALGIYNAVQVTELKRLTNIHSQQIIELQLASDAQVNMFNEVIEDVDRIDRMVGQYGRLSDFSFNAFYLSMVFSSIETNVKVLVESVRDDIKKVMKAAKGEVCSDMLKPSVLLEVLSKGSELTNREVLYDLQEIMNYYLVMTAYLTEDSIVIKVPVGAGVKYHRYRLYPFPTYFHGLNKTLVVELHEPNVFLSREGNYLAVFGDEVLEGCRSFPGTTICAENMMQVHRVSSGGELCYMSLLMGDKDVSRCSFMESEEDEDTLLTERGVYLYFKDETLVSVRAQNGSDVHRMRGNAFIGKDLSIDVDGWTIEGEIGILYKIRDVRRAKFINLTVERPVFMNYTVGSLGKLTNFPFSRYLNSDTHNFVLLKVVWCMRLIIVVLGVVLLVCYKQQVQLLKKKNIDVDTRLTTLKERMSSLGKQEDV